LKRFTRAEPIHARPISRIERAWRWRRRNPIIANLAAALFAALLAGTVVASGFAVQSSHRAVLAQKEAERANGETKRANGEAAAATRAKALAQAEARAAAAAKVQAEKEAKAAREAETRAEELARLAESREYHANMLLVQSDWEHNQFPRFLELLERWKPQPGKPDYRNFEWYYWQNKRQTSANRTPFGHGKVVFSSDGQWLASCAAGDYVRLRDPATGTVLRTAKHRVLRPEFDLSPDSRHVAAVTASDTVSIWDIATDEVVRSFQVQGVEFFSAAFRRDGRQLVTTDYNTAANRAQFAYGTRRLESNFSRFPHFASTPTSVPTANKSLPTAARPRVLPPSSTPRPALGCGSFEAARGFTHPTESYSLGPTAIETFSPGTRRRAKSNSGFSIPHFIQAWR
jgi:hypothetical protein